MDNGQRVQNVGRSRGWRTYLQEHYIELYSVGVAAINASWCYFCAEVFVLVSLEIPKEHKQK